MFDFAWSEIALIGVVALIAIGPKDMPVAIKAISDTIKKLRRMAGEFQGHVDEMIRDADLGDVKTSFDELRRMNLKNTVRRAIDPDGSVMSAFSDPFKDHPVKPVTTGAGPVIHGDAPTNIEAIPAPAVWSGPAPAFIPPGARPPAPIQPRPVPAPAFIPPSAASASTAFNDKA